MSQQPAARNGRLRSAGRSPAFRSPCCWPRSGPASPMWPCRHWPRRSAPPSRKSSGSSSLISSPSPTLVVGAGRLGDVTGRRRLLLAGIVLFTAASVLCGVAPTLWLLIGARAAQGVGAAIMMALTMAFVGETVPKQKTGSTMGLLGTMSAVGTALGPSLGGVLIAGPGWQAIFLINVPLGILTFVLAYRALPADRRAQKYRPGPFRHDGHAAAGADARGLCPRHDDGARPFRCAQHRPAGGCGRRPRPLRACRGARRLTFDPVGDVPRSRAERQASP